MSELVRSPVSGRLDLDDRGVRDSVPSDFALIARFESMAGSQAHDGAIVLTSNKKRTQKLKQYEAPD